MKQLWLSQVLRDSGSPTPTVSKTLEFLQNNLFKMDLGDSFQRAHHFTRTSLKNIERFREALGLAPAEAEITENRKVEVSVDFFGDWFFTFRTLAVTNVTKVTFIIFNKLICIVSWCFSFHQMRPVSTSQRAANFLEKWQKTATLLLFKEALVKRKKWILTLVLMNPL